MAATASRDYLRVQDGTPITRPRKIQWLLQDRAILNAQQQYQSGKISGLNFLQRMQHRAPHHRPMNEEVAEEDELAALDAITPVEMPSVPTSGMAALLKFIFNLFFVKHLMLYSCISFSL